MSKLATLVVAVGAFALAVVTLVAEFRGSRLAPWRLARPWRERLCRTALGLVRSTLSLLGALRLRLPLRLLPVLAWPLLPRLVLGTRAAKAIDDYEGRVRPGRGPSIWRRSSP